MKEWNWLEYDSPQEQAASELEQAEFFWRNRGIGKPDPKRVAELVAEMERQEGGHA
jgi:hypothetical protein